MNFSRFAWIPRGVLLALALSALIWAGPHPALAANALGGEFQVNTTTDDNQARPSLAELTGGGFVVVYTSLVLGSQDADIRAQIYGQDGTPVGEELLMASAVPNSKMTAVTGLTGGGFAVAWDVWANQANGYDINARVYNGDGQPVSPLIYVAAGLDNEYFPSLGALTAGEFEVAWTAANRQSERMGHVFMRRYNQEGNPVTELRKINKRDADKNTTSCVVGIYDNSCMIFWDGLGEGNTGWNVFGQKYDAGGKASGANFVVHQRTPGVQWNPAAANLADGKLVVTWTYVNEDNRGDIYGRVFNYNAQPQSREFVIAEDAAREYSTPSVTGIGGQDYVVVWDMRQRDENNRDSYGQRLYGNGNKFQDQFRVHNSGEFRPRDQDRPKVVSRGDQGYVVIWESYAQDGYGFGIFGQMYY